MCGAFSILHPFKELGRPFNAGYNGPEFDVPISARPGQDLPVILNSKPNEISLIRWGLKPSWKKTGIIINTRKESLEKPYFYQSFLKRRCIIPADGFYEWGELAGKKIPYCFSLKDDSIFGFAGIWDINSSGKKEFTIITTEPNITVAKVHDRMPAILLPKRERQWLDAKTDISDLIAALNPFPDNLLKCASNTAGNPL